MDREPTYEELEQWVKELEKENRDLSRLYETATAIGSNLSLEDTLESITSHIIKLFNCSGCAISLWLRDKNQLKTLIDSDKFDPDGADKPDRIYDLKKYPETLNALKTGQTYQVQIDDPVADKAEIALMKEQNIFEYLMLPLTTENQVLGLLEIYNDVKLRNFTKRELRLAETLAVKTTIALENAHLYKAAQFEINNRKLAEEALKKAHDELEQKVEKRTSELVVANEKYLKEIAERKQAERNFERAQRISKIGSWYYDWDSETEVWSDECFELYGINKDDYPDNRVPESLSLSIYENFEETNKLGTCLAEKHDKYELEYNTVPINGQAKNILQYCEVEKDNNGNVIKIFGTDHDITERKQAEEALRKAHDELEQRVQERTEELETINEQLKREIEERKQAEEERAKLEAQLGQVHKMEAIGTLAGGIAHEFNNLLGIIVGNTELAMDGVPEWNTAHYNLEEIMTASLRAGDVVKQILAFSRQSHHELKPVRLNTIVKESIQFFRSSIPTTIEIRQDISSKSDIIRADVTQINQILINLCTNAAHAMRKEGGVLSISLENVELDEDAVKTYNDLVPGNYVKLTVSDTGSGIDPESIDHIFDPFYTTKEVGEGTGMGLSVIHGIVRIHDGDITVYSEIGKGSTFQVLFPVIEEEVKPEIESKEPLLKGNEQILFVDDEESLVFTAKRTLGKLGYDVVTKRNPIKALEIFKEQPDKFDLVISDMAMPGMTGDRFAKEIMKINPNIPTIVCTGYSERMSEEESRQVGISAYVMKPYLVHKMAKTIRRVLDEKTH